MRGDEAVAGVDPQGEPAGILRDHVAEPLRPLERRGAEDDARQAHFEERLDRRFVANTAAKLALHVDGGENVPHRVEVHRLTRTGAIEIDEVKVLRSVQLEARGDARRVVREDRLPGVIALLQPNAAAPQQINRGPQLHNGRPHSEG